MNRVAAVTILIFLTGTGGAFAQNKPAILHPHPDQSQPCVADFDHFCNAVPAGQGRKIACLQQHRAQLMPACRARLDAVISLEKAQAAKNHEPLAQWLKEVYAMHEHADDIRTLRVESKQTPAPNSSSLRAPKPAAQPQQRSSQQQQLPK